MEAKKEEFIAQMQEIFTIQAARKYPGYMSQDIGYEVVRDDDALFILRFDAILYAGNSVEYHRHVVMDKGTGQVLELARRIRTRQEPSEIVFLTTSNTPTSLMERLGGDPRFFSPHRAYNQFGAYHRLKRRQRGLVQWLTSPCGPGYFAYP